MVNNVATDGHQGISTLISAENAPVCFQLFVG